MSRLKIKMTHEKEEEKRRVKRGGMTHEKEEEKRRVQGGKYRRTNLGGNATKNTLTLNAQNNPL
jgi:hypothetical protein